MTGGCGLVFSTDCFDGTCSPSKDASPSVDVSLPIDAGKDVLPDVDVADAFDAADAADTAPPPCEFVALCNATYSKTANFCGGQNSWPGSLGCIYYCIDDGTPAGRPCIKRCAQGCDPVNQGVDHCHNEANYACP